MRASTSMRPGSLLPSTAAQALRRPRRLLDGRRAERLADPALAREQLGLVAGVRRREVRALRVGQHRPRDRAAPVVPADDLHERRAEVHLVEALAVPLRVDGVELAVGVADAAVDRDPGAVAGEEL